MALFSASFDFADIPAAGPPLSTESDAFRVSRHFAAGLEYLLVEPRDVPEDAELPMVVFIHGRSSMPRPPREAFFDLEEPVRVIMPRGPDRSGYGYAWMPVSAHDGERPALTRALVDRADRLAVATREWRRRYPTRGLPIVVGFSQGGMLAMELATAHPSEVAEVIPLAGWLPPSRMPSARAAGERAPAIHALHGTRDRVLSPRRSVGVIERLRALGYPARIELVDGAGHEQHPMRERTRAYLEDALRRLPRERGPSPYS